MTRILIAFFLISCFFSAYSETTVQYQIQGLENTALDNAQKALDVLYKNVAPPFNRKKIHRLAQQGETKISLAVKAYGYFEPKIHYTMQRQDDTWLIQYTVKPGKAVTLKQVNVNVTGPGVQEAALQKTARNFPLQPGESFDSARYEEAKRKLFSQAEQLGYLTAKFTQHIVLVDPQRHQATINLVLATGPRYYFGPVHFHDGELNDEFLQRFVPFQTGEPYNRDQLLTLEQRLEGSNYFSKVSIDSPLEQATNYQVPTDVELSPIPRRKYRFGVGFGTDTGPRALLGFDWRRVNRHGHRFNAALQASAIKANLQARYEIPGEDPLNERYVLSTKTTAEEQGKGDSLTQEFSAASIKQIYGWEQTLKLTYQIERFRKDKKTAYRTSKLMLPSISWSRMAIDNVLEPTDGYRLHFTVRGAAKQFLSDTSFTQIIADGDYYYPLFGLGRFHARAKAGYSIVAEQDKLPLTLNFYSGGAQNIRGYRYKARGPGKYLAEASIEYQHRIRDKWYLGPFVDVGNASNHSFGSGLQTGVGLSLTWASPVGPLNLSVGQAVSKDSKPILVQFSMGSGL